VAESGYRIAIAEFSIKNPPAGNTLY